MRKDELVFVHSLLVVVRRWLVERDDVSDEVFEEYDAEAVPAAAINRRKAAHEEAIWHLLGAIHLAVTDAHEPNESSPAPADA